MKEKKKRVREGKDRQESIIWGKELKEEGLCIFCKRVKVRKK